MLDVVALGELLIDFTGIGTGTDGYPVMAAHPGGAPANFLATLARFGAKTALIGKVGTDSFGKMLVKTLSDAGIETRGIVRSDDVFTTLAFVTLDANGDRTFSFARKPGADTALCFEEADLSLIDEAKVFHIGTLSLTDEPARSATVRAVTYAREKGKLITCDPNLRKPLWRSMEDAKKQMLWALRQADVVKISDEEVEFLWDISPEEGAEKLVNEFGVKLAFVTCGAKGCFFKIPLASGSVPGMQGLHVIDTTGAGDIFGGAAVWKLLKSGKKPEELNEEALREIASFACRAAGLSTTVSGGIPSIPPIGLVTGEA
ncbi:MAG: carbohydrate kinase [Lachnospiraceae bacterium]|nr:carbohydrate kinase [Lachnospiraceae bacterium]